MTRKYFGTDGIRGTVGHAPITPDFVMRLAHAVGRVLRQSEKNPVVLIGKDTRISGYMLESALESGFNSAGNEFLNLSSFNAFLISRTVIGFDIFYLLHYITTNKTLMLFASIIIARFC
jgi:phosphomannomutase